MHTEVGKVGAHGGPRVAVTANWTGNSACPSRPSLQQDFILVDLELFFVDRLVGMAVEDFKVANPVPTEEQSNHRPTYGT